MANTLKLRDGMILKFKANLSSNFSDTLDHTIFYKFRNFETSTIFKAFRRYDTSVFYVRSNNQTGTMYDTRGTLYNTNDVIIYGDQVITDTELINWLYDNTISGLPILPHFTSFIKEIFLSSKLLPTEETNRTNIVIEFDKEGVECIYTNEATDIPALITHKRYGVFFGVKPNDVLKVKYNDEIWKTTLESIALGEIDFEKEV